MPGTIQVPEGRLAPLFFSPGWPLDSVANGIVTYVDSLTSALRRLGHAPCVLTAAMEGAPWPDVYPLSPAERSFWSRLMDPLMFRINPRGAWRRRSGGELVDAARRVIRARNVDLLEMEETHGWAKLVKPRLPIPLIVRLHGPHYVTGAAGSERTGVPFRQRVRAEGEGLASADGVSAPSRYILDRTRAQYGFALPDAAIIPNPAPIVRPDERWKLCECARSRILFVGRFDRVKGGDIVIDSFRILLRTFPDARLWFAGSDDGLVDDEGRRWRLADYIAARAPEATPRIDYLGRQPNSSLGEFRRKAMVTVVGSRDESFSLTTLEAMAFGCPVVATPAGGIPEMLRHEENSLLCRVGEAADMAALIGRLLANAEWAAGLGRQAAADAAERYHPDTIARQTAEFYRRTLDRAAHRPSAVREHRRRRETPAR